MVDIAHCPRCIYTVHFVLGSVLCLGDALSLHWKVFTP